MNFPFSENQLVLCRHPKHRSRLIGTILKIEEDMALVELYIDINGQKQWWFEMRTMSKYDGK